MRIEWKKFKINNKIIEARVSIDEAGDKELIKTLYFDWKNLKQI